MGILQKASPNNLLFSSTKYFFQEKPSNLIKSYLIGQKIKKGDDFVQRNFDHITIQKSGKNRTRFTKILMGKEDLVQQFFLTNFCPIRYLNTNISTTSITIQSPSIVLKVVVAGVHSWVLLEQLWYESLSSISEH